MLLSRCVLPWFGIAWYPIPLRIELMVEDFSVAITSTPDYVVFVQFVFEGSNSDFVVVDFFFLPGKCMKSLKR